MRFTCLLPAILVALLASCANEIATSEAVVIKGVRIDKLHVASRRDSQRRASLSIQITNTTDKDIPGMQMQFLGNDDSGKIGPFWLPRRGAESEWSLKAGESRSINTFIIGFGVRDVSNVKPVDVEILGANVREVADRPEPERRMIFALLVSCEQDADRQALKRYPENLDAPGAEQMKAFKLRTEFAEPLRVKCVEKAKIDNQLTEDDRRLISSEGVQIGWPPLGSN